MSAEVFHDFDGPAPAGGSAVTIGKFDGFHRGHQTVLKHLVSRAESFGLSPTVITFDRNPKELLGSPLERERTAPLTGLDRKIELLSSCGVERIVVMQFNHTIAQLAPDEFIKLLVERLDTRLILVGGDFRFGAGGAGSVETLQRFSEQYGYRIEVADDLIEGERRVSSSWIRALLDEGKVAAAGELLGRPPELIGVVVQGAQRGRELGFPTANLSPELTGYIPAEGIYAGYLTHEGREYQAAISVGNNPTFEGVPEKQVEAHLLDTEIDLYGEEVRLTFTERIREMTAFTTIEALIEQIAADVAKVRGLLND